VAQTPDRPRDKKEPPPEWNERVRPPAPKPDSGGSGQDVIDAIQDLMDQQKKE
jgi:hypothetical protein